MNKTCKTACLEVTLEQAREWYESNNEELKKLALTMFGEEMLIPSFEEIMESENGWAVLLLPLETLEQTRSLVSLQIVANYLNNDWHKTDSNIGYFLGMGSSISKKVETDIKGLYVGTHQSVKYPGVVYFRTEAGAQKAVKILGNKLLPLLK